MNMNFGGALSHTGHPLNASAALAFFALSLDSLNLPCIQQVKYYFLAQQGTSGPRSMPLDRTRGSEGPCLLWHPDPANSTDSTRGEQR